MTHQQQVLQGISDTFGGTASMDQILGGVAFGVLIVGFFVYVIVHQLSQGERSPFDSLH